MLDCPVGVAETFERCVVRGLVAETDVPIAVQVTQDAEQLRRRAAHGATQHARGESECVRASVGGGVEIAADALVLTK